jgi:hypothetical protein
MLNSLFLAFAPFVSGPVSDPALPAPEWSINATIIEACSCAMFCQCYFNANPTKRGPGCCGDEDGVFCRFNNAFKVNRGSFGSTKLDGLKFWVAGDLGGDFSKMELDWAVCHFEKAATPEQREAVLAILPHVYPARWSSFTTGADGEMTWRGGKDDAHAALDGGKTAEVKLRRYPGNTDDPIVIHNLKYWGVPRNDGFVLMPNEVEAYRAGTKAFEFKGTNGFMITIDMNSGDATAAAAKKGY